MYGKAARLNRGSVALVPARNQGPQGSAVYPRWPRGGFPGPHSVPIGRLPAKEGRADPQGRRDLLARVVSVKSPAHQNYSH
jgi:hypothetical protein